MNRLKIERSPVELGLSDSSLKGEPVIFQELSIIE